METMISMPVDVRNYLYLIEEQGGDPSDLMSRYRNLENIDKSARGQNPDWLLLEKDTIARALEIQDDLEPSSLDRIISVLAAGSVQKALPAPEILLDRIHGGWLGRIAGCILGKPVECLMKHHDSRAKLKAMLTATGEYPLNDFISEESMRYYWEHDDGVPSWFNKDKSSLRGHITCAPADDDLNYTVLGLMLLERRGKQFTPDMVLDLWHQCLPFNAVCTAEKIAYRNRVIGLSYPQTALFHNPYCEWIGAQIRADIYGYVSPGNGAEAARMAWGDAASSHTRNGIYGAMWVASSIAAAFTESEPETVIRKGMEQIPPQSRLYYHLEKTIEAAGRNGSDFERTFEDIEQRLGKYHCVHTVNNACIVAAALLHGQGDFEKTICIAVMGGLDTDCNGATAGSIAGVMMGTSSIPSKWKAPFGDTLRTSIAAAHNVSIYEMAKRTAALI